MTEFSDLNLCPINNRQGIVIDGEGSKVICKDVACRAKRKKLTRKMQKIPFETPFQGVPNGIILGKQY